MRVAPNRSLSALALGVAVAAGLLGGCSSPDGPFSDDAGSVGDSTTDQDASPGCGFGCNVLDASSDVPCPAARPAPGTACFTSNECEYGSSWWMVCNAVETCTLTGWQDEFPAQTCAPGDAGSCPATFAAASSFDAGAGVCPAAECQYPDGYCVCLGVCENGSATAGDWYCAPATAECPSPRPKLGTSCAVPGVVCDYGEQGCGGCGVDLACLGGVWRGGPTPVCP